MRASTLALPFGAVPFALPVLGPFVTGVVVLLVGAVSRWLGG
ncbi:hypothetical protein [Haloplanus halophilus]|nr:hypothetical protein [Haloplanus sp. GDY1]